MVRVLGWLLGFLLLSSCAPSLFDGMRRQGKTEVVRGDLFPLFDGCDTSLFFDARIKYKANVFSGVLVLSPADSNAFRMVFTSHFGPTVLDLEVGERSFIVHHCMEGLDRRAVLSILEQDFRALLMLDIPGKCKATHYSAEGKKGYKLKANGEKSHYLIGGGRWLAADRPGLVKALRIRLDHSGHGLPKIVMEHPKLGLAMEMEEMIDE